MRSYFREYFEQVIKKAFDGSYDLLVLDELIGAAAYGIITPEEICRLLKGKPEGLEVVMTGRKPDASLVECADYVSEIRCVKHPYQKGIPARKGVEF